MLADREFDIAHDDSDAPIECETGSLDLPETDAVDALATYICPKFPLTVCSILKFCCPKGRNELLRGCCTDELKRIVVYTFWYTKVSYQMARPKVTVKSVIANTDSRSGGS